MMRDFADSELEKSNHRMFLMGRFIYVRAIFKIDLVVLTDRQYSHCDRREWVDFSHSREYREGLLHSNKPTFNIKATPTHTRVNAPDFGTCSGSSHSSVCHNSLPGLAFGHTEAISSGTILAMNHR